MKRHYSILLYLLLTMVFIAILMPMMLVLILMGSMASDSGCVAAAYITMGLLSIIPIGSLVCIGLAFYSYFKKKYSAAIRWSILSDIFLAVAFLLGVQEFYTGILGGFWLIIGFYLYLSVRKN